MSKSKELNEKLKPVDKTTISFDIPVLERIKLECLSFVQDEFVKGINGDSITIGEFTYRLGVKNVNHHLSIGRALFKLISSNPSIGDLIDKKRLSVREISNEVSKLARSYKDLAFESASQKGIGFEVLNYHRIPDAIIDIEVLVEAVAFMPESNKKEIEIYSQDETTKALRIEIKKVEKEEEAKKKEASAKKIGGANALSGAKAKEELVKPNREDPKYAGLLGEFDYEADLAEYEKSIAVSEPAIDVCSDGCEEALDVDGMEDED